MDFSFSKNRRRTFLLIGFTVMSSIVSCSAMDLETIIQAIEFRESRIHDIRCKSQAWLLSGYAIEAPQDTVYATYVERFADNFTRRYIDTVSKVIDEKQRKMLDRDYHEAWSTPGDKLYGFNYTDNSGHITSLKGYDWSGYQLLVPLGHTCHPRRPLTLSESIRGARTKSFLGETERINGLRAYLIEYVLDVPRDIAVGYKVWLSPEKDWLPVRIEEYKFGGAVLLRGVNVKAFFEPESGIVLPQEAEITLSDLKESEIRLKSGVTWKEIYKLPYEEQAQCILAWEVKNVIKIRWRLLEAIVNKGIPKEDFVIRFPGGARVWDEFANISYNVSKP
jgi:hypothetical protein